MSTQLISCLLNRINYNNVNLLPYNNDAEILASQIRSGKMTQILTGKGLMKLNVEREARRLQLYDRYIIDLATDKIWNLHLTSSQRNQFISLANDANNINKRIDFINDDTIERITRIPTQQITNNNFEH